MRVNSGADVQARQMGGDTVVGVTGTSSSAPTATTLTDSSQTWTVNAYVGHWVAIGAVFGLILSNTATVLTIDMWHQPTLPIPTQTGGGLSGETAGATPASGTYEILPGNAPAWYMGLSTSATAPSATDTLLASELWAAGGGLNRSRCSYSHTTGASSFLLSKTYIMNAADNAGASATINKIGTFQAQVTAAPTSTTSGPMMFETAVPNPPVLVSGDQVALTDTVSI